MASGTGGFLPPPGGFLPPPGSVPGAFKGGRLAPPPSDSWNDHNNQSDPFGILHATSSSAAAPSVFDFGNSDPFAINGSGTKTKSPAVDAFGFPIETGFSQATTKSKSNEPPNLLDF